MNNGEPNTNRGRKGIRYAGARMIASDILGFKVGPRWSKLRKDKSSSST